MSKIWTAIHPIVTTVLVATAMFFMTQCGCSATTRQTVIHDVGDVTSCIAPAIAALETCKASKGTTAQCAVAAVVELIACVTTAQQPPAMAPAAKETSMIDKTMIQRVQWGLDMPKEVNGTLGKLVGPVAVYLTGGGLLHVLAFEHTSQDANLWGLYYDRDEHRIAALQLETNAIQLLPAPPRPTETGHNPACSCVDCTQKRLSGQATNVAAPAPLPTGPEAGPQLPMPDWITNLETGGSYAPTRLMCDRLGCTLPGGHPLPHSFPNAHLGSGLPSAEFPNTGTVDSLTAYFDELRNMVEAMNRRHEAMATEIRRNTQVIDALVPTVNAHAGLLAEHHDELNRALKLDRTPHGAEAPVAGAPVPTRTDSAG